MKQINSEIPMINNMHLWISSILILDRKRKFRLDHFCDARINHKNIF